MNGHWSLFWEIFFTENFKNDLLWLIALRAVKVRDSLQNWGVTGSGTCASCPLRKTTDHCFLNCIRIKRVWARFAPSLTLVLGIQFVPNTLPVSFFLWPSAPTKRARIARHLVKSIPYGIWVFRNKATFYNLSCDHRAITKFIVSDLRQKVRTDFLRLSNSRFSDLWILDCFCTEEGGLSDLNV